MTDTTDTIDAVRRAAADLVPQLSERLARHGLAEIEVRHGQLRLRVTGAAGVRSAPPAAPVVASVDPQPSTGERESSSHGIPAPAVGFFVYADGLGPGLAVEKGDALGWVEVLGVRHDVRAPRRGTVRSLVAESGEAVEYGQVVLELEPAVSGP